MRFNTGAQWAFRIGAMLFILLLSVSLNTLDLFAVLYPNALHQEESYFWKVLEPLPIAIAFAIVIPLDLFLGRLDRDNSTRNF